MNLPKNHLKMSIGLMVALAVTVVFSLSSFAAPDLPASAVDPLLAQDCTGTLTFKKGTVTVNGNAAQTGATIMSGSVVSTTSGHAFVELGALGRVELSNHTTVVIICAGNTLTVRSQCGGKTDIEVKQGQVTAGSETIVAGQEKEFSGPVVFTSTGTVDMEIECEGDKGGGGLFTGPGLWGLLALIGIGAAVAIGIAVGDEDSGGVAAPPVSPARP